MLLSSSLDESNMTKFKKCTAGSLQTLAESEQICQQNLSRFARLSQQLRADIVVGSAGTSNLSLEVAISAANFRIISRNQQ